MRWSLAKLLPGLASNLGPLNLFLLSSCNYSPEPPCLALDLFLHYFILDIVTFLFVFTFKLKTLNYPCQEKDISNTFEQDKGEIEAMSLL
jgi:hypothetical protein